MKNQILIRGEKPKGLPNPSNHNGFQKAHPTLFAPLQIEAYQRVKDGRSCALVAPTSSGKTLAVAAPLFESKRPAVFVLPFRSLIRDQTHELPRIASIFDIDETRFGVIQGGTSEKEIADTLHQCDYILMTPDKLISLLITGRKGNSAALSIISRYDFVFDEIHVFNTMMLTSLRYFLRSVRHWQVRRRKKSGFYFLSATFPDEIWQMLQEEIGLEDSDRIEGVSYTGNVTLRIKPAKETNIAVIAKDIRDLDIETNTVGIFNSAYRAWQVCEEIGGLLFIGQDKMSEIVRICNFDKFRDYPEENALIGSPAIEAGVDFVAHNLVIEESHQDSSVQRFGRAARSGHDAFVLAYSDTLAKLHCEGKLKSEYERQEFLALLREVLPVREPKKVFAGLAAYTYYCFWQKSPDFPIDPDDLQLCHKLEEKEVDDQILAFRSLTPYTRYDTGESINYQSLFRKNLPITDEWKVRGAPHPSKYFFTPDRPYPILATEKVHGFSEQMGESLVRLAKVQFHHENRSRTHWVLLEILPRSNVNDRDDNLRFETSKGVIGRNADGSEGKQIVRFYSPDI